MRLCVGTQESLPKENSSREQEHVVLWALLGHWCDGRRHYSALLTNTRHRSEHGPQYLKEVALLLEHESSFKTLKKVISKRLKKMQRL